MIYTRNIKGKPTMSTLQHEEIFDEILEEVKVDYPHLSLVEQVSIASQRFWNFSN